MSSQEIHYFLECKVSAGMFSSERSVSVRDAKGKYHLGFFDQSSLGPNGLQVDVIALRGSYALVQTPNFGGGYGFFDSNRFLVPRENITPRP